VNTQVSAGKPARLAQKVWQSTKEERMASD